MLASNLQHVETIEVSDGAHRTRARTVTFISLLLHETVIRTLAIFTAAVPTPSGQGHKHAVSGKRMLGKTRASARAMEVEEIEPGNTQKEGTSSAAPPPHKSNVIDSGAESPVLWLLYVNGGAESTPYPGHH